MRKVFGGAALLMVLVAVAAVWHVWRKADDLVVPEGETLGLAARESGQSPAESGQSPSGFAAASEPSSGQRQLTSLPRRSHPLLGDADAAVLDEPSGPVRSWAGPELAEVIRAMAASGAKRANDPAETPIQYDLYRIPLCEAPSIGSGFPPFPSLKGMRYRS